jgi:hypothetical protein
MAKDMAYSVKRQQLLGILVYYSRTVWSLKRNFLEIKFTALTHFFRGCKEENTSVFARWLSQLVRFSVVKLIYLCLNTRFDMYIIFTANYSFSRR